MIITAATPQELVKWFHTRQEDQRVLCVLLAPSQNDQRKLTGLIGDIYEADAVLGEEIALLLLHPGASTPLGLDKGYGGFATLRGTAFPSTKHRSALAYSLRNTDVFRDMSAEGGMYRQDIAEKSSQAMALFVPEFMNLLGVTQSELPAMCVLVKGLDESVVLPLGREWNVEALLALLGSIREACDRLPNFQAEYKTLADELPEKLPSTQEVVRELDAKTAHIADILERLLLRYAGSDEDRNLVAEFVSLGFPSVEQLDAVLAGLSFSHTKRFQKDGQVSKVNKLMARVDEVRHSLSQDLSSRRYVLSISERAKCLVERRTQLFGDIRAIKHARLVFSGGGASSYLRRVRSGLENINLTGDLGEKLMTAVEWVRKLVGT